MRCTFYLGTHMPQWLRKTAVPLFVSRRRFHRCRSAPVASGPWVIDSGGFTELKDFGRWTVTARQYVDEVRRWQEAGGLEWAAVQDWMCEPFILAKTGLTVGEHQRRTLASWFELTDLAPEIPWAPVLQGWRAEDYHAHLDAYRDAGVDLAKVPVVGVGSVCRRQGTREAAEIIRGLAGEGLRLHGFGFKVLGLPAASPYLQSADSMAWSTRARRGQIRLPGCTHRTCANCLKWALVWRQRVEELLSARPVQETLF